MLQEKSSTLSLLLTRRGRVYAGPAQSSKVDESLVRAVKLELGELGYQPSHALAEQFARLSVEDLTSLRQWLWVHLAAVSGADKKHVPLFRSFPQGIPANTNELWWKKVLVHHVQGVEQPCIFCGATGTTHVLRPCEHVVCDNCFDGSSYSACPVCEHRVDMNSPFFRFSDPEIEAAPPRPLSFKLLVPVADLEAEARDMFGGFCQRRQSMSSDDKVALSLLAAEWPEQLTAWMPERIAVRENQALILGVLLQLLAPAEFAHLAMRYIRSATDLLRVLTAASGADVSLMPERKFTESWREVAVPPLLAAIQSVFQPGASATQRVRVMKACKTHRFRFLRLNRPRRRMLLALLESFPEEVLTEDMLRHRSRWVWAGEFLHPHEYAKRYPGTARAFAVVRRKAPDGTPAPPFRGYAAQLEHLANTRNPAGFIDLLARRPGELMRRLDHGLRLTTQEPTEEQRLLALFQQQLPRASTPALLALQGLLPHRLEVVARRVFWPRGAQSRGYFREGSLPLLDPAAVTQALAGIESELLERAGRLGELDTVLLDRELSHITAPFNERSASPAALELPRGSMLRLPEGKFMRLFLHWCQPQGDRDATDLDLSVGFFNGRWRHEGTCSYYQLRFGAAGSDVATSSGDLRNAPWPDGASEFIDLDLERAEAMGLRFAVMVVNAYEGLPFDKLDRVFAGAMLREQREGAHFDPRSVALRFNLRGAHGVYLPLVVDLQLRRMHWLDIYSKGQFAFNNIATSSRAISTLCPTQIEYFAKNYRPSLWQLGLLHAAARARRVLLRGGDCALFERGAEESPSSLLARLGADQADRRLPVLPALGEGRLLAALLHADLDLPPDSRCYALFNDRATANMSAAELLM